MPSYYVRRFTDDDGHEREERIYIPRISGFWSGLERDTRSWGDPEKSAQEDEEIMAAFAGYRREANEDLT